MGECAWCSEPGDSVRGFCSVNCDAVCFLGTRVGFLRPDGEAEPGAKFGSAVWYFGPRRRRFDRVWSEHGHVDHGLGPLEEEE